MIIVGLVCIIIFLACCLGYAYVVIDEQERKLEILRHLVKELLKNSEK